LIPGTGGVFELYLDDVLIYSKLETGRHTNEGEILELNEDLETSPEDVNNDPYERGWMIKMKVSNPSDIDNLLTSEDYKKLIGE